MTKQQNAWMAVWVSEPVFYHGGEYLLWGDKDTDCSGSFQDLRLRSRSRIWRAPTWTRTAWSSDTSSPKTLRPANSSSARAGVQRRFLSKVPCRASLRRTSTKVPACCPLLPSPAVLHRASHSSVLFVQMKQVFAFSPRKIAEFWEFCL